MTTEWKLGRARPLGFALLLFLSLLPNSVARGESPNADAPPPGFATEIVSKGLDSPTAFAIAPDGRIFVTQKAGTVKIVQNGKLLRENFIDLSAEVNQALNRGLVGIAIHPKFPNTPYVYLSYVYQPAEANKHKPSGARVARVVRVSVDPGNPNRADPNSLVVLLGAGGTYTQIGNADKSNAAPWTCENPDGSAVTDCIPVEGTAHQTDALQFGPDGALYVAVGDGGEHSRDTFRGQDLNSLSGKILRIDPSNGKGYRDNPFYDGNPNSNQSKIYIYGLRNPFRFTFAPSGGDVYIGDVGESDWEEIDRARRGANLGWPCLEGTAPVGSHPACAAVVENSKKVTLPIYMYPHTEGRVAVVGGDFYRGKSFPEEYRNAYFFADYNIGTLLTLAPNGQNSEPKKFAEGFSGVVQMTSGPDGALYVLSIRDGVLYRIRYTD